MSKMWIRKSIAQLPIQKLRDCVNPLMEMSRGDFNAEKDLSKSQRRKQWFAGWKFMAGIRAKLWQGAARVDVYILLAFKNLLAFRMRPIESTN